MRVVCDKYSIQKDGVFRADLYRKSRFLGLVRRHSEEVLAKGEEDYRRRSTLKRRQSKNSSKKAVMMDIPCERMTEEQN